ncbi:MAG: nitrilase-related carbon-nitrogen hydrolase [Bacillota bacterium]|nr:nitrilase-related carbon-nitrogen hydrolase [Bacillota bacterium]
MRVAALTLARIRTNDTGLYKKDLSRLLENSRPDLAVLPAFSSLVLGVDSGAVKNYDQFDQTVKFHMADSTDWNRYFLNLHSEIASSLGIFLTAGTIFENKSGSYYHTACCFDPDGRLVASQQQTHLTFAEKKIGLSRGEDLHLFNLGELKAGLVIGNDARHPEIGRIFGLLGADILLCSGALRAGPHCWQETAGMWAQVQQNQFWAVEANLNGQIANYQFGAAPAVLGPCEITPGQSGYLERGYPDSPLITARLDQSSRLQIKANYPLLEQLNPEAYDRLLNRKV